MGKLLHTNEFQVTFWMSLATFDNLLGILYDTLLVDVKKSEAGGEGTSTIFSELVVAMSLRWLAGGVWQDIKQVYGVSKASFYCCRDLFPAAVLACPELDIHFPETVGELDEESRRFESISRKLC